MQEGSRAGLGGGGGRDTHAHEGGVPYTLSHPGVDRPTVAGLVVVVVVVVVVIVAVVVVVVVVVVRIVAAAVVAATAVGATVSATQVPHSEGHKMGINGRTHSSRAIVWHTGGTSGLHRHCSRRS